MHHVEPPCFSMQKNTQHNVTQWWSINKNNLCKIPLCILAGDVKVTCSFTITVLSNSHSLTVTLSLCSRCLVSHLSPFFTILLSLSFPLSLLTSVVAVCSLSDRFGSCFRRWEAGSISRVSVYSSWVMTLTVASVISAVQKKRKKSCFRLS